MNTGVVVLIEWVTMILIPWVPEPQKFFVCIFFEALVPRIRSSHFSNLWTPTFELFLCPHGEGEVFASKFVLGCIRLAPVYLVDQKNWERENFVYNFQIDLLQMTK